MRENDEGLQGRLRELSDHNASVTPVKERGKDVGLGKKHLRLQCNLKEVQRGCWEVLETKSPTRGVLSLQEMALS